eukprot:XP_011674349.1 PREDICTED: uncharacterized protein LOC105443170 [Strongylocentrotus purpuratus]
MTCNWDVGFLRKLVSGGYPTYFVIITIGIQQDVKRSALFLISDGLQILGIDYVKEAGVYGDGRHDVQWDVGFLRKLVSGLERAYRASKDCEIQCTVLVFSALNLSAKASDLTKLHAKIKEMTAGVYGVMVRHDVQLGCRFSPKLVSGRRKGGIERVKTGEIQCTVLVFSAVSLSVKAPDLKKLHAKIKEMTGYPPIVIITHRNQPDVKEEVLSEFRTGLQILGIDYVKELENYTRDNHQYDAEKHLVLLEALHQCTMVGDQVIKNKKSNGGCLIL